MPPHVIALIGAIVAEVIGTSALQASQQFTRIGPSLVAIVGYGASLYLLAIALRTIPVGIAYAIWSGLGVVLISLVGLVMFGQKLDLAAVLGLSLIIAGVVVLQVFSTSTTGH